MIKLEELKLQKPFRKTYGPTKAIKYIIFTKSFFNKDRIQIFIFKLEFIIFQKYNKLQITNEIRYWVKLLKNKDLKISADIVCLCSEKYIEL